MNVVVYSKTTCPWCDKAKELLKANGIPYQELLFERDFTKDDLKNVIGDRPLTVPQVLIDNTLIGGYEKLAEYFASIAPIG